MTELLRVRGAVLALLEKARGDQCVEQPAHSSLYSFNPLSIKSRILKSSLEAELDLILPEDTANSSLVDLLQREGASDVLALLWSG